MSKLKKRADGLYQMSVMVTVHGEQKRKYFYGRTQQEAKKKMMDWQETQAAGRSFKEVAEEWQTKHWEEITAGTQTSYAPAVKRALDDFSDKRIREIIPLDIKRSVAAMAAKNYAQHSVAIYLSVLNQIFNHAILMQDVTENPTETVSVPKGLSTKTRECPEDDKLEIIRQNVDHPFGLFPYMLLYTGLRRGELLALQWRDIDISKRTIRVTKSVTYAKNNQPQIKSTKTEAGKREIILMDRLAKILFPLRRDPDDYIFGGSKPLTMHVFQRRWANYCIDVGLFTMHPVEKTRRRKKVIILKKKPSVTPHQLRHAFATICFEAGIDPKDAQQLLGHSKIEITMDTYTHIRKKRREEVAAKLNNAE